jgi:hypothetical protein
MVVEALAVGAIAILKQYLGKTGEGFAKKVGEKLADKVGQLYQSIKNKFQTDPDAKKTLEWVEEDPTSTARVSALEGVLKDKLLHDELFQKEVDRLVQDIKTTDIHNQLVSGERNLTVGGDASGVFVTGDSNQIGKP